MNELIDRIGPTYLVLLGLLLVVAVVVVIRLTSRKGPSDSNDRNRNSD